MSLQPTDATSIPAEAHSGIPSFLIIWFGQLVSLLGSGLVSFALGIWVYQQTGVVSQLAIIYVCNLLPGNLISPLAGTLVDRWDRRWVMILSDCAAACTTLVIVLLLFAGRLEVWHIYLTASAGSIIGAFQFPAYAASIPLLVPHEQLGRANGMVQVGQALGRIFAPALAGVLVLSIQLQGVILIDLVSFLFAVGTLLVVRIPQPETTDEGEAGKGSLLHEALYGWTYITARPGLLGLLLFLSLTNFLVGVVSVLWVPLVLSFASSAVLGTIASVGGVGMLVGSSLMSIWGGPQRRIHGVLGFISLIGVSFMAAGARPSAVLIAMGAFLLSFAAPIVNGSFAALCQSKVVADVQGRFFAFTRLIAWSALPLGYLIAGPLADYICEPLLMPTGPLAGNVGVLIGVGPGRGIGLLCILMGSLTILLTATGYLYPHLRLIEDELPDVTVNTASV